MPVKKEIRDPIAPAAVMALPHHADWHDGREGYLFCRFDATLSAPDDPRHLRAEVTWGDDLEDDDNETGDVTLFHSPELRLETNYWNEHGDLTTVEGVIIALNNDAIAAVLAADPKLLLVRYAAELAKLKTRPDESPRRP